MTMFIIFDDVDDCYVDDDDEHFDQVRNPSYNHDYDDNFIEAYDNGCDLDH